MYYGGVTTLAAKNLQSTSCAKPGAYVTENGSENSEKRCMMSKFEFLSFPYLEPESDSRNGRLDFRTCPETA